MKTASILINALFINWNVNGGTGTYTNNIIRHWYEGLLIDRTRFLLLCTELPDWYDGDRQHFRALVVPYLPNIAVRIAYEQVLLPFLYTTHYIFNPGYVSVLLHPCPQITTIHDAYAWVHPQETGRFRTIYWRVFISIAVFCQRKHICVSRNTQADLDSVFGKNLIRKNSVVIHEDGSHIRSTRLDSSILAKYNLETNEYFLAVGIFKKIKNPEAVLSAFKVYREANAPKSRSLVLAGYSDSPYAEKLINRARAIPGTVCLGRISDEQLAALYMHATALLFTSLYEGFGIPILEAQHVGCPVITSRTSSMPEVAGADGALFVNPHRPSEIATAMLKLHSIEERARLIEAGLRNAERFSWRKSSQSTLELIVRLFERENRPAL